MGKATPKYPTPGLHQSRGRTGVGVFKVGLWDLGKLGQTLKTQRGLPTQRKKMWKIQGGPTPGSHSRERVQKDPRARAVAYSSLGLL